MRSRYEDDYWEARFDRMARMERALRERSGFSWGTLLVGIIIGAILF